jgi:nudix-type nucleoside diphosphatase (YffH/AdpP family)
MLVFKEMADVIAHAGIGNWYLKTARVQAIRIDQDFTIVTTVNGGTESVMNGKAGDVVCIGIDDEIWRVEADIFKRSYDPIPYIEYIRQPGVEVESANRVFNGFFKVDEIRFRYQLPNGEWFDPGFPHLVFNSPNAVAMVVYNTDTDTIELVRQYRIPMYTSGGWITELPAGICGRDTSPNEDTLREVKEELGYDVPKKNIQYISTFALSPGRTNEKIILSYVEVNNSMQTGDPIGVKYEGEHIERLSLKLYEALRQINTGEICDAKTIIGINWLATYLDELR